MKSVDELTIGQARELASMFQTTAKDHPWQIGEDYIIRTVTMTLTGRLVAVYAQELVLEEAAWIADAGRWHEAVGGTGGFSEVEPWPDDRQVIVGRGSIIDASIMKSKLNRVTK